MINRAICVALLAIFPACQALAQASDGSGAKEQPGTTGWNSGGSHVGVDKDSSAPASYQPPVVSGLDLKGPTKTEGPWVE
jgi:hypothetical protein